MFLRGHDMSAVKDKEKKIMFKKLKYFYSKQTLHKKVSLSIFMFSIIPLFCLAGISLLLIYRNQVGSIREEAYEEIRDKFNDMNHMMDTIELTAQTVWSDTSFMTEIGKNAIDNTLGAYNRYIFREHTLSTLRVITSINQVRNVRIYLDYPGLREYPGYLYSLDRAKINIWYDDIDNLTYSGAWYMDVAGEQTYEIFSDYLVGNNMASFVLPLRITSNLKGILEIVLPMEAIVTELFEDTETKDTFLVDSRGRMLGIEEKPGTGRITEAELADIMGIDSLQEYEAQGIQLYQGWWHYTPVILSVVKNENTGIFLIQLMFIKDQYVSMAGQIIIILLIEVLLLAVLIKAINGIVDRLLRDFGIFTECIREVEDGNLDVKIPGLEQIEINEVATEYNKMLIRVKELMEISIHREVMVKEAQLKSLEKQIDSHFLYNVLDSIKMMAEVKGIYNVSDALLALGRMFRYNLQIDSHSVTLQEEISYLESYLKLCNIRYDYQIHLSENIEETVKRLKVPKIILQPIAENAIVHGLDELAEDTAIYLKAYVKDEHACIEMTDMGRGMDERTLERVRWGILNGSGEKGSDGIGLHNIHERIQLMYGEQYGVEIYSKEGCYTKIVLKVCVGERI